MGLKIPNIFIKHGQLLPIPDKEGFHRVENDEFVIQFPIKQVLTITHNFNSTSKLDIDELKKYLKHQLLCEAEDKFPGNLFKVVEQPETPSEFDGYKRIEFKLFVYDMTFAKHKVEKNRITLHDDAMSALLKMTEGYIGAVTVCTQLLQDLDGLIYLCHMDDLGIYGSDIWMAYKEADEDIEKLKKRLQKRDKGN